MLRIKELSFSFGELTVLNNINAAVEPGKLYALFGPNGTGKTTLFKCIMKIYNINHRGEISVDGKSIHLMKASELARKIAYVPQEHKPPFPYTVKEVVLMGRTPHMGGVFGPSENDIEMAIKAMKMVDIEALAERFYMNLSGGQRQLVLLARAFAQDANIMLLDEPTSNLDFKNQLLIWSIIRKIVDHGKSAVICTHDPNHVLWFCDRVMILGNEGFIIAEGEPVEIINDEMLNRIYGHICNVSNSQGHSIVMPKVSWPKKRKALC